MVDVVCVQRRLPARWIRGALVTAWVVLPACVSGVPSRGYALYPDAEHPRPRNEIARLVGPIRRVDDRDVSGLGSTFDLLPGCHVVKLKETWGDSSGDMAVTAQLGDVYYAIPMKAGHNYVIEIRTGHFTSNTGELRIEAREQNAQGDKTQEFPRATTVQELEACLRGG